MGFVHLLKRNGELRHTYSDNLLVKLTNLGWEHIATAYGWNVSMSYWNDNNLTHGVTKDGTV